MSEKLDNKAQDVLFRHSRTHNGWLDRPVTDQQLHELYDLLKWAPTSANGSPARFYFVKSKQAKEKLKPALMSGNVEKTMAAPVTAIIAYDLSFHDHMPRLFPVAPDFNKMYQENEKLEHETAFRNSTLQGAYLILAARTLGLDCGPMSGFDNKKVDETFFAGTRIKSNFLCNIGYGDHSKLYPRGPRLSFDEAAKIL